MAPCPFCEIVSGDRNAHRLYEDDRTVAFLDHNPAVDGHTLIVPRTHHEFLFSEDDSVSAAVFRTVHRLSMALDRTFDPDGVSVFYTSAELIGNVSHAHVHLLPRHDADDIHLALARGTLDASTASELTGRIRAAL